MIAADVTRPYSNLEGTSDSENERPGLVDGSDTDPNEYSKLPIASDTDTERGEEETDQEEHDGMDWTDPPAGWCSKVFF